MFDKFAGAVAASLIASSASAAVVGDEVTGVLTALSVSLLDETTVVTDPGVEFSFSVGSGFLSFDIAETAVTVIYNLATFPSVGAVTTWDVSGFDDQITGFSLASGKANLIDAVSFTADSISLSVADFFAVNEGAVNTWIFDLETSVAPVPLPASGVLLVAGLAGLGFASRRNKLKG
ncbi:VPLPA-CTERM sorting domain-containing protein [Roseobacter sp. YSTF-M11]|uniref:VPLPA-CTERM sorting domain-containing protein n=2 Tax=Roseobacter insulae TaxID=2859783 RepID=A0A9X1FU97_9RHOB|nr:VPLPA-CTERM sorting domain-containing protein [Roseobacter insulae]